MIRYRLQCPKDHQFDAWFANSAAYETQSKRGLVTCAVCGSTKIEKALMAPNVGTKGNKKADKASKTGGKSVEVVASAEPTEIAATNSVALTGEAAKRLAVAQEMMALLRKVRAEVEAKAEYVGPNFAEEARKIHYDEAPNRGIYGEATKRDVVELLDEGIDIMPLPDVPEDRN
jgi:hypothetical protein